jgi:hypothetical protein
LDGVDRRHIAIGAVVVIAVVVGLVLWLVLRGGSSTHSGSPIPGGSRAVPISVAGLRTIASLGIPVYWAGTRPGYVLELTKGDKNRVYLRYVPEDVQIGSRTPHLTIGTYPLTGAYAETVKSAGESDSVPISIGNGGIAYYRRDAPTNVFFAYPGSDYQVEVYDPAPGRARALVTSGRVEAVG